MPPISSRRWALSIDKVGVPQLLENLKPKIPVVTSTRVYPFKREFNLHHQLLSPTGRKQY
ncbi:hypothetical protein BC937DRAFT_86758 [Endogone sp. FLAS-F59071]|nr:hypothetical protein BC937DRAFT_86758 [Endogone sp. FLAS-F59071]|eukprot:RUS22801.1 hypothetical protein BC937DRAFT_86758 [Endogone sp. FLAS-F59071]